MRTASNAARAFALAATLDESLYRRWPAYDQALRSNMGGYPTSTIHGGGGRGGGPSDPTGEQAIHPEHDRARYDAAQTDPELTQAAQLFVELELTITATIAILQPTRSAPKRIRSTEDAQGALDLIGYAVEHCRFHWHTFHKAAGDTLDRSEAYADLRLAVDLLSGIYETHCRWLEGGDPVRVHCGNRLGCPDRNPPAVDCLRCWACQRWLNRYDEERTRAAEKAAEAPVGPSAGPPGVEQGPWNQNAPQAGTEPHSAPGFGYGAWTTAHASEGAA